MRAFLFALSLALLSGCPAKSDSRKPAPKKCTAFGEQCEFAPGKLGSCVMRDDCAGGQDCYVCQSQH